jgi:hypothetical protein
MSDGVTFLAGSVRRTLNATACASTWDVTRFCVSRVHVNHVTNRTTQLRKRTLITCNVQRGVANQPRPPRPICFEASEIPQAKRSSPAPQTLILVRHCREQGIGGLDN